MSVVRTWLPISIIVAGLVLIAVVRDENGLEGGILLIASGLSVWLLNWFYRVGVRGDRERHSEDDARDFFDEHGYWPDEAPAHADDVPPSPHTEDASHGAPHRRAGTGGEHPHAVRRPRDRPPRRPAP